MISRYERRLLLFYASNIAARFPHQSKLATALASWMGEHADLFEAGARVGKRVDGRDQGDGAREPVDIETNNLPDEIGQLLGTHGGFELGRDQDEPKLSRKTWESLKDLLARELASARNVRAGDMEANLEAIMRAEGLAMRPGPRPNLEPGLLPLLRDAIRTRRVVEFEYASRSTGHRSRHRVQPYGVLYGNRPYLVGKMTWADDVRLWRLSNISDARCLDDEFEPDPEFDLREYAERSFGAYQEPPFDVVLQFDAGVAEDAATFLFHPTQSLVTNDDGSLSVSFRAGGLDEMCWHLFTWGPNVRVLKPERLRQRLAEMCSSLGTHHSFAAVDAKSNKSN